MSTIGILLFDGVEELDVVGPWEVFTASSALLERAGAVRCRKGMRVLTDFSFTDHPPLDVLVVPGGDGVLLGVQDPALLRWLAEVGARARWVVSVCTGALLLHASGLGKGRRLATHWAFEDRLAELGAEVVRDARWVRDGNVVSSQGVSAGIDVALWLVGQLHSPAHARATQRYIQYDPAPPYADG
ncbi:DJ-1/PfpI family protein [Pseudonocardia sp. S2-4]|uniref:DJ-1/PfpI family protein n=1 Tax=Pseudonocardia humida TaxID=2800819 RepID=A0ABT1A0D5_9PSEU|nr:DJ-1/PfpI family protein [Pseudonocardia humida]